MILLDLCVTGYTISMFFLVCLYPCLRLFLLFAGGVQHPCLARKAETREALDIDTSWTVHEEGGKFKE